MPTPLRNKCVLGIYGKTKTKLIRGQSIMTSNQIASLTILGVSWLIIVVLSIKHTSKQCHHQNNYMRCTHQITCVLIFVSFILNPICLIGTCANFVEHYNTEMFIFVVFTFITCKFLINLFELQRLNSILTKGTQFDLDSNLRYHKCIEFLCLLILFIVYLFSIYVLFGYFIESYFESQQINDEITINVCKLQISNNNSNNNNNSDWSVFFDNITIQIHRGEPIGLGLILFVLFDMFIMILYIYKSIEIQSKNQDKAFGIAMFSTDSRSQTLAKDTSNPTASPPGDVDTDGDGDTDTATATDSTFTNNKRKNINFTINVQASIGNNSNDNIENGENSDNNQNKNKVSPNGQNEEDQSGFDDWQRAATLTNDSNGNINMNRLPMPDDHDNDSSIQIVKQQSEDSQFGIHHNSNSNNNSLAIIHQNVTTPTADDTAIANVPNVDMSNYSTDQKPKLKQRTLSVGGAAPNVPTITEDDIYVGISNLEMHLGIKTPSGGSGGETTKEFTPRVRSASFSKSKSKSKSKTSIQDGNISLQETGYSLKKLILIMTIIDCFYILFVGGIIIGTIVFDEAIVRILCLQIYQLVALIGMFMFYLCYCD